MSREMLCRMPVAWPAGCDRRALIDARLGAHLALWEKRLSRFRIPGRPVATWLSDRVLEIRSATVTFWAVLTETEVTVFWDAPLAIRVLITQSGREAIIAALQADMSGLAQRA